MTAVVNRGRGTVWGAVLLPLSVVVGYALVTVIGFWWTERPVVAIVASITVSILLWLVSAMWFWRRTGWWRSMCLVPFAVSFAFPMVGAATLGTDLALEQHADRVSGTVNDIAVEQTNHKEGQEAYRTTYTFVSDDGRELGTVDYRGNRDAYELDVGDRADLLVDPSGDLPVKLADEVDSAADIGMIGLGGVLFLIVYLIGLFVPMIWRPRGSGDWWT